MPEQPNDSVKISDNKVTIYQLEKLIDRCIDEALKAKVIDNTNFGTKALPVLRDRRMLVQHISKTIIGELYELEVIRKMVPFVRMFGSLHKDFMELGFDVLNKAEEAETAFRSMRIEVPKGEPPKAE